MCGKVAGDVAGGLRALGTATLTDSTVSGNTSSAWHGGGLFVTDGTVTLTNVTVADNIAPAGTAGGIVVATFGAPATVELANTIVAGNTAGGATDCAVEGGAAATFVSTGHNLDSDSTCGLTGAGDQPGVNPLLGALADKGGPTRTHAPALRSPAVDAGDNGQCDDTDQRGVARADGACDVGAVEFVPDLATDSDGDGVPDVLEDAAGSDPNDPDSVPQCDGRDFTILGSLVDDVLEGTNGRDVIVALDGDDTVHARNGDDVVCGGRGDDQLHGGNGSDQLHGDEGRDTIRGGNGNDVANGGADDDRLYGNNGRDQLDGGPGDDQINGGRGRDQCDGESTTACEAPLPGQS
jgi:Ca2+-binding RTX toxin-like protein